MVNSFFINEFGRNHRFDHELKQVLLDFSQCYFVSVLLGDEYVIYSDGNHVLPLFPVLYGNLDLCIRVHPWASPFNPAVSEFLNELAAKHMRKWH